MSRDVRAAAATWGPYGSDPPAGWHTDGRLIDSLAIVHPEDRAWRVVGVSVRSVRGVMREGATPPWATPAI